MKILLIIHNQAETGPYFKVLEMCRALAAQNIDITLMCTSKNNRLSFNYREDAGVRIIESPDLLWGKLRQGLDPWNTIRRVFALSGREFDLIHAIDSRPTVILPALWYKKRYNAPLILSWWDWFGRGGTASERSGKLYAATLGAVETFFEEHFRKYADRATVITRALAERLQGLGYPPDKIEIHRVGCFIGNDTQLTRKEVREKLNIPEKELVFCYAGTLFESDKRLLLESLRILKQKSEKLPKIILIGNHQVDPFLRNEFSVTVTGYLKETSEVQDYLKAADFALLPMNMSIANRARWPSKITDYWAAGLPVIATPVSDLPMIFNEQPLGVLSRDDSPGSFAEALLEAVKIKPNERQALSDNCLEYARRELDWNILAGRLKELYIKTLEEKRIAHEIHRKKN